MDRIEFRYRYIISCFITKQSNWKEEVDSNISRKLSMGDTSVDEDTLTARSSTVYMGYSAHSDADTECDAKNEDLRLAISRAKQLIRELSSHVMKSPIEESSLLSSRDEASQKDHNGNGHRSEPLNYNELAQNGTKTMNTSTPERKRIFKESIGIPGHDLITDKGVLAIVTSLIKALEDSQRQTQQLKFKNMLIKSNSDDIQSTFEVEENLRKQQFERMKCQLLLDKQQLLDTVRLKESKIAKYKNRIVEKNRLINKLMRTLNENSISDTLKNEDFPLGKQASDLSSKRSSFSRDRRNDMLKTLGLLASQVLNDEIDDDSANQTIIQPASGKISDCNTTETDILNSPSVSINKQTQEQLSPSATYIPDRLSQSGTPIERSEDFLPSLPIQLPKMKSFSTVDGTIKDVH